MHFTLSQRSSIWKRTLTLAFLVLSTCLGHSLQGSEELYRGTWVIDTPDNGGMILILKRNGRASYFWGENTDRTVYQGTWAHSDSNATATWPDGSQHSLQRDTLGFGITYKNSQGSETYTVPTKQMPKEILGQWAKPPAKPQALASDRDKAKGFFGIWQINESEHTTHYVFIEPDRSAASTWSPKTDETRGLRGAWAKQGSELHIIWDLSLIHI